MHSHAHSPVTASKAVAHHNVNTRGISLEPPIQMQTHINHDTATFSAEKKTADFPVGVGMQAVLDPGNPVVGSATSKNATPHLASFCNAHNPSLEQTHLLNADLGGFGVHENLYPLTPKANRDHFNNIERHVKGALGKAAKNYFGKDKPPEKEGTGIYYQIGVEGTHSFTGLQGGTALHCEAYYIDDVTNDARPNTAKQVVSGKIMSAPGKDGQPAAFQPGNWVVDCWSHKQGNPNPNATENQAKYITKREGKADLNTAFSKYTKGMTWEDYRKTSISVDYTGKGPATYARNKLAEEKLHDEILEQSYLEDQKKMKELDEEHFDILMQEQEQKEMKQHLIEDEIMRDIEQEELKKKLQQQVELKVPTIKSDLQTVQWNIVFMKDKKYEKAAKALEQVLKTMMSDTTNFNHVQYINNTVLSETCDENTQKMALKYLEFTWQ